MGVLTCGSVGQSDEIGQVVLPVVGTWAKYNTRFLILKCLVSFVNCLLVCWLRQVNVFILNMRKKCFVLKQRVTLGLPIKNFYIK